MKVKDILQHKGTDVRTIGPEATIQQVMETLVEMKERAEEDQYFSARDRELRAKLKQQQDTEREETLRKLARARCPEWDERLHPGTPENVNPAGRHAPSASTAKGEHSFLRILGVRGIGHR